MPSLHQYGWEARPVVSMDLDGKARGCRKDALEGAIQFLQQIQFLDMALGQLRIVHYLCYYAVGVLDFLPDNAELFGDIRLVVLESALKRINGIVNDGQRVLDLVSELRGQTPGGMQLTLAQPEFTRFLLNLTLALQQHLHTIG